MKLRRRILSVVAVVLILSPTLAGPRLSQSDGLELAWERARAAGAYRFIAEIEQTLSALPPDPRQKSVGAQR